jgi:hypothetical protein
MPRDRVGPGNVSGMMEPAVESRAQPLAALVVRDQKTQAPLCTAEMLSLPGI